MSATAFNRCAQSGVGKADEGFALHIMVLTDEAQRQDIRYDEITVNALAACLQKLGKAQCVEDGFLSAAEGIVVSATPEGGRVLAELCSIISRQIEECRPCTPEEIEHYTRELETFAPLSVKPKGLDRF